MSDEQIFQMPTAQIEKLLAAAEDLLRKLPAGTQVDDIKADRDLLRAHLNYR